MIFPILSAAANITVMSDRDPAVMNESFQMIFESDASVDDDPDFSPLNRDFQVLSTSTSSNMSIINGKISTTKRWTLTIIAKREGRLTIPSVSFGKDRSQASTIMITRTNSNSAYQNNNREIFLEVEASPDGPYVQSQVSYKIRLFRAVATTNAVLSDPEISGARAVIERIDDDRSYETRRIGKRFVVVERTFAIYPQASGRINIEPIVFQAQISQGRSSFFGNPFGPQPKTVVVQSDPVILNVKAIPDTFIGNHWLPAQEVELVDEWPGGPLEFNTGDPVTRTLRLKVKGQMSSQLPEMPVWQTEDFKQYPDQPTLSDERNGYGITGIRVEKIALIPNKAGRFVIPGIRLPWWNTIDERMEYAEIPEREITVSANLSQSQGSGLSVASPPIGDIDLGDVSSGFTGEVETDEAQVTNDDEPSAGGQESWKWLSIGLLLLWVGTIIIWFTRGKKQDDQADNNKSQSLAKLIKQLKQACRESNPEKTKELLLQWARVCWPDQAIMSISDIAKYSGDGLVNEIHLLNTALYSRSQGQWNGENFIMVFLKETESLKKKELGEQGKLEPLFKI